MLKRSVLIAWRSMSIGLKPAAAKAPVRQAETHKAQLRHLSASIAAPVSERLIASCGQASRQRAHSL